MDEINADGGNDFVDGGAGYDDIFGGDGLDILNGGEGNDCVSGGPGDDTLWSGSGEPDDSGILNGDCGLSVLDGVEDSGDCAFFSITDVTVLESDGIAVFTVTLSRGLASQSIVDVETADGSAVANSDYIPLSRRTLSFVPGETVKLVEVPVMDDASTTAATEIFHLVLSDPIGAHR